MLNYFCDKLFNFPFDLFITQLLNACKRLAGKLSYLAMLYVQIILMMGIMSFNACKMWVKKLTHLSQVDMGLIQLIWEIMETKHPWKKGR